MFCNAAAGAAENDVKEIWFAQYAELLSDGMSETEAAEEATARIKRDLETIMEAHRLHHVSAQAARGAET